MANKRIVFLFMIVFVASASLAQTTPAEAKERLAKAGYEATLDDFRRFIEVPPRWSVEAAGIVDAYLVLGVIRANEPMKYIDFDGEAKSILPLHRLLQVSCSEEGVPIARLLLMRGADITARDPLRYGATPIMVGGPCPKMAAELLKWKPDLTLKDNNGSTAMHWAFLMNAGEEVEQSARLLMKAGFDLSVDRKYFLSELERYPALRDVFLPAKPAVAAKTDWKALPPYAAHSAAEAALLLSPPGNKSTVDDHFWDAITSREPMRLALALQAGANIRQTRQNSGYTPLVILADRCMADDAPQQVSLAEQLIAAGAEVAGKDSRGANALILAADDCPAGVVRALLAAGIPPSAVTPNGDTALKAAILDGRADVVKLLLDAGVDPRKEPYNTKAFANGNKEILELLKKKR